MGEAAAKIGTTKRSLNRYCARNPDYRNAVIAARAAGDRLHATNLGASEMSPGDIDDAPPSFEPDPNTGGPRPGSVAASEIIDVDLDLVQDVDDSMPVVEGLPPITVHSFMALMWKRAHGRGCSNPAVEIMAIKVCDGVIMGPMMRAQKRRDDATSRVALAESVDTFDARTDSEPTGEGMVFLELPFNGSEAPGHGPRPIDAEVVR